MDHVSRIQHGIAMALEAAKAGVVDGKDYQQPDQKISVE